MERQAGAALPEATIFGRIVVALGDGSYADQLGSAAIRLVAGPDAEVLFVQVAECSACCGPPDHPALHEHERDLLRVVVERLVAHGIRARGEQRVTVSGRVSKHILDAVEESRGDLLIIARRPVGTLPVTLSPAPDREAVSGSSLPGVRVALAARGQEAHGCERLASFLASWSQLAACAPKLTSTQL